MSDKFKFSEKERSVILLLIKSHFGILNKQLINRIESIIQDLGNSIQDGWQIGQYVYHKDIYKGKELMRIVGIRENEVELEGDYSGGTHNVCQRDWESKSGLLPSAPKQPKK